MKKPETLPEAKAWLEEVSYAFSMARAEGEPIDEPEGVRVVRISDTLRQEVADGLRHVASLIPSESK